jgi:hypothetical protein
LFFDPLRVNAAVCTSYSSTDSKEIACPEKNGNKEVNHQSADKSDRKEKSDILLKNHKKISGAATEKKSGKKQRQYKTKASG